MQTVLIAFSNDVLKKCQLKKQFTHNFVLTSNLNDLYTNLWQFEQAVILLEYVPIIPITNNEEEFLSKDMNLDIVLFKFLKLLKYKKVLVTIEKIESKSNINQMMQETEKLINYFFNDLDRKQIYERNVLILENPKIKVIQKLNSDELNKFFHKEQQVGKNKVLETECLILSNEGPIHQVKILQGNLYEGQLLESNDKKVFIKTVEKNDKGNILVSFEGNIVLNGFLCCPLIKPDIIKKVEFEVQLCQYDYFALKDTFRKMGNKVMMMRYNQKFDIENTNTKPIDFIGLKNEQGVYSRVGQKTFNLIKLEINIEGQNFFNLKSESPIIFFKNESDNILFYGRISKIIESTKRNVEKVYCFPLPEFDELQIMKQGERDLRYCCRICKQKQAFMIPNQCGHLRYCDECIINCLDNNECYYCNVKITGASKINKIVVDQQTYKQLIEEKFPELIFDSEIIAKNQLPALLKISIKAQKDEGIHNFYSVFCQSCNKNVIENFATCQGGHVNLICKECQPKCFQNCNQNINESRKIVYDFCDDYQN